MHLIKLDSSYMSLLSIEKAKQLFQTFEDKRLSRLSSY